VLEVITRLKHKNTKLKWLTLFIIINTISAIALLCSCFVIVLPSCILLSLHNLSFEDAIEMALDKPLWGLLAANGATH